MGLTHQDKALLSVLKEDCGLTTGQVACLVSGSVSDGRERSAEIRSRLMGLREDGLVDYLFSEKVICWIRTPAGSEAVKGEMLMWARGQ